MRKFMLFVLVAAVAMILWAQERQSKLAVMEIEGSKEKSVQKVGDRWKIQATVVIDEKTGLSWQRTKADGTMSQHNAEKYCKKLSLGGYHDWRLPSISELKTLIVGCQSGTDACKVSDSCRSSKCWSDACYCNSNGGPGEYAYYWQKGVWEGAGSRFWSSSKRSDDSFVWDVNFSNGDVNSDARDKSIDVRCVRDGD